MKYEGIRCVSRYSLKPGEKITPNFSWDEFVCKCGKCKWQSFDVQLFPQLELVRRDLADQPIIINSGFRCEAHNKSVGGVPRSYHIQGKAVDVTLKTNGGLHRKLRKLANVALTHGFTGIKVYNTFVHLDMRPGEPMTW